MTDSKKIKLTADEAKKKKQRYCKVHGNKNIIHKDFSLCCHLDCLKSAIYSNVGKTKMYQHMIQLNVIDDFASWVVLQLLEELQQNKPPVLNHCWCFYKLQYYYATQLVKGIVPLADCPSKSRKEMSYLELTAEIIDEIDNNNLESAENFFYRPDRIFFNQEIIRKCSDIVGPDVTSVLLKETTIQDLARIKGITLSQAKRLMKSSYVSLKEVLENER